MAEITTITAAAAVATTTTTISNYSTSNSIQNEATNTISSSITNVPFNEQSSSYSVSDEFNSSDEEDVTCETCEDIIVDIDSADEYDYCGSCEVTATGTDGSLWGWENDQSCRINTNECQNFGSDSAAMTTIISETASPISGAATTTSSSPIIKPTPSTSGLGMHVEGNKLLDGNGNEFVFRGVNVPHEWFIEKTESSIRDIADLGANSVRVVLSGGTYRAKTPIEELEQIIAWCEETGLVAVLELHDFTGKDDPNMILSTAVNYWTDIKDFLNAHKDYIIVNIANEWIGSMETGKPLGRYLCHCY